MLACCVACCNLSSGGSVDVCDVSYHTVVQNVVIDSPFGKTRQRMVVCFKTHPDPSPRNSTYHGLSVARTRAQHAQEHSLSSTSWEETQVSEATPLRILLWGNTEHSPSPCGVDGAKPNAGDPRSGGATRHRKPKPKKYFLSRKREHSCSAVRYTSTANGNPGVYTGLRL